MKQHIEKTEQLIKKIDSILEDKKTNIEYGDKFQRMRLQVQKINDWAQDLKLRTQLSDYREDQDIAQTMYILISACENIQKYIKIDEVTELSLPKLKESLTNIKNAQEQSYNQASYADIMDKILLIEESYQNGKLTTTQNQEKSFNAEKAVKELLKLEKLEILQDGSVQANQLIEIIKNHKKEMGVTVESDKKYEQELKFNKDLEEAFATMEEVTNDKLNELISLEDVSGGYRPEFEDLCERVDIIIRDFVDAEGSLYDSTNLTNLINESTKLKSQFEIAYSEQEIKLNQSKEKEYLNQNIQNIIMGCERLSKNAIPTNTIDSQLDMQKTQLEKFASIAENMPASVLEGSYKFLLTHYNFNITQAVELTNQGLIKGELLDKCEHSLNILKEFFNNAQQFGIELQ